MDSLESTGLGTAIASAVTWIVTRALSYLRKRTVLFARVKPAYISFVVSVCVVALMHLLKINSGLSFVELFTQVIAATLISGGFQANVNDFRGKDAPPSHIIDGRNLDLTDDFKTKASSAWFDRPGWSEMIESYVTPNYWTRLVVEKLLPYSLRSRSLRSVDILVSKLYKAINPEDPVSHGVKDYMSEPIKSTDIMGEMSSSDKKYKVRYFDYVLLEHAVLATLLGSDYVRTIIQQNDIFNIFYFGKDWRLACSGITYIIEYNKSIIVGHRGAIIGKESNVLIENLVIGKYKEVDEMLGLIGIGGSDGKL